jgi:Ribbon-helix-helix protein, copG family
VHISEISIRTVKQDPRQRTLDLKRDAVLPVVRVSEAEKRRFKALAEARHTNLTELIRQMLHAEADKLEKGKVA